MKYLVYLLLLANLGYLAWNLHLERNAVEAARELPPLPAGAVKLLTLQEYREQQEREQRLELEQQQQQAREVSEVDALTMTQPPGAGMPPVCGTLGPFPAEQAAQAVAAQLEGAGIRSAGRSSEQRQPDGYWVYLPSMERRQVLQAVSLLEARGDREYYVGRGNYLSLGTFSEERRAQNRLTAMRELGFDPILQRQYNTRTEYWLDIEARAAAAAELDAVMQENPQLRLQETACP